MIRMEPILNRIKICRAAVLGDFTLDFYINIDDAGSEISVETGLPTMPVSTYSIFPGGAGNVAVNLIALGVKTVKVFGITGNDMFGSQLHKSLEKESIDISGMLCQKEEWSTHVYTKLLDQGIEKRRIDFGNFNVLHEKTVDKILDNLGKVIDEMDIVIINQQLKNGIHTSYFRKRLVEFIRDHPQPLYITDSRNYPESYNGSYRKINRREAQEVLNREGIELQPNANQDQELIRILYSLWGKTVFLTRGENGIIGHDETGVFIVPGISLTAELDTVGAGDTTIAAISAALGSGFTAKEAATLGNMAASITVQKLHTTGTATKDEILKLEQEAVSIYNPELASDISKASFWKNTEIEIINPPARKGKFRYILFDHDGTLSTLRQGWEEVMEPMMLESIIGAAVIPPEFYQKILLKVHNFIDKTTGIQTLIQMQGLINLVKEFNLVPENQILDKYEYKKIYNTKLMKMVTKRTEKFRKGELSIEDVTIKNSVLFLKELNRQGAITFLASGTDEQDVIQEAELLGYADLFTGGIFGATKDIRNEPKKMVIDSILKKIGQKNTSRILTIGDGPVEIAETKKAGGFTIGIASNEIRRYGLNIAKRTRLIRAGADLIIPDYSQMEDLFTCLEG